jgi:hypothetical protein
MCVWPCKRQVKPVPTPQVPQVEVVIKISKSQGMKYLVERFIYLVESINTASWFQPPDSDLLFEAIRTGEVINTMKPRTKEERRLYRDYKRNDKFLEDLLRPKPRIYTMRPPTPPPQRPTWHTKVERFDMNGNLLTTQYL